MDSKKVKIISIVSVIALAAILVGATYAYFQAQTGEGSQTDIKINANTVDTFTFETGSSLSLNINQDNFASGKGNQTGSTYAKAILTANNKTNSATEHYYLYLNISDNTFMYTQDANTPEILLTIKDGSNNEITSISGLNYKTVTDGKGTSISGFDITTKNGIITLFNNREITTTSTKTDTWNITATFVNYNADQSKNAGRSFSGQVLISKDSFDDYTPNTINTLSATKSGTNLTVNLNVEQGSNEIDKYYYAIEESNGIAMLNNNENKVQRLSNKIAANTLTYIESTSSSYTFTNLSTAKNYKISAYVVDKKKLKSNTYEYNYYSDSYVYPVINKVETSTTSNSITAVVTATKGTNNISKYYYSIDGGNTFIESTSNSYTFNNLTKNTSYKIVIKVMDSNNKYSNVFVTSSKTNDSVTLADYVKSLYTGTQGANNIYYHNSSLANGAGDSSYRYSGANPNNYVCFGSDEVTCPEDNLYRIIGVFGNQVKLIKATIATSSLLGTDGVYSSDTTYSWSSLKSCPSGTTSYIQNKNVIKLANKNVIGARPIDAVGCNDWKYSELNTINLNKNYLSKIGSKWANMVDDVTWKISGHSSSNITAREMYNAEIATSTKTYGSSDGISKIGLLYVSDYGFAASPSAWTTKMSSYNSSSITSVNWLYLGVTEWTISPLSSDSVAVLQLGSQGNPDSYFTSSYGYGIRPVLYLESSIKYLKGTGTEISPLILQA